MKTLRRFSALAAFSALLLSGNSFATEYLPAWTHVASACSIDESSLAKYQFNFSDFGYKSGMYSTASTAYPNGFEPIVVRCNVTNPVDFDNPKWNTLMLGYQDQDGTAAANRVTAILYAVSRANGTNTPIAGFDSNSSTQTVRGEGYTVFSKPFDFLNNEYYVEIAVTRRNVEFNPVAFMVRLTQSDYKSPTGK
ncbi:hypothetical protein [Methylomagnum sp.]